MSTLYIHLAVQQIFVDVVPLLICDCELEAIVCLARQVVGVYLLQEVLYCSVSSAIESGLSLFRIRPFGPNKKYKIVLIRLETDETRISPAH